jgi:HEAT repeat protein
MRVVDALGRLGGKAVVDALLGMLHDENPDVRRHAIGALGKIRDPASADRTGLLLKDRNWNIRLGAALALLAIGDTRSLYLLKPAHSDENKYVSKVAVRP